MSDNKDNPLYNIFIKTPKGELTEEIESVKNIHLFFNYLKNDKIKDESKEKMLSDLTSIIAVNRYVAEFFSFHDNYSIYIHLYNLFTNKNTGNNLKEAILDLIDRLRINIQTGKEIYEFLFQKLSQIYRGEIPPTSDNLYKYLKLLHRTLADTEGSQTPKNYFSCSGDCKFFVDLNKNAIEVGYSFTIILNFKVSNYIGNEKDPEKNRLSSLITLFFSNKKSLSIDLQYPYLLIVKEIRKDFIKTFPLDEWINLVITIVNTNNSLFFYFFVNGENHPTPLKIQNLSLRSDDTIKYIDFFNNFYGEVSSILMFSQTEPGTPGANNSSFLSQFKNYKEGLWKKKIIDSFFKNLDNFEAISVDKSKTMYIKSPQTKINEKKKTLKDILVFAFTPINYNEARSNYVEDAFGAYQLQFKGNIRNHKYQSYQKKLILVGGFSNFYPIAEMFLIYPETLTEENFELFLKTIGNLLNFRKQNLKTVKQYKLIKILSMFMEKYPNKVYTEKILNALYSLGKTLFINNLESICSNYFNYILLNEKILSKYNENLQIKFWNKLFLFCQSDITQIEIFVNINRLCLILRFYDKNKYKEICCPEHLNMIKDEFVGSKKVMNPTMKKKLSQLKNIMDLIIRSQDPINALALFKLLTLDLSPCLVKFILNIFINAFTDDNNKKKTEKEKMEIKIWKEKFVELLIQAKYEVIIINTFLHALPDVRIELLKFIYQIHCGMASSKQSSNFKIFGKMIKTCLLPEKMFYSKKLIKQSLKDNRKKVKENLNMNKPEKKKEEIKKIEPKKEEPKKIETKKEEPKIIETKKEEIKKEEPKQIETKKDEPKKEETKKEEIKKEEPKQIEIKKEEPKKEETKKEESKKEETTKEEIKKITQKIEEVKKEESKKEVIKKEEPKKIEPKKEEPKKIVPKKEEPKKEEPKKIEPKKEELKKSTSNVSQIELGKKNENVLKQAKTFQIKDNPKKEENTKVIKTGANRKNFLALLSKFDKPQNNNTLKNEVKKPPPQRFNQRDNPLFKTLKIPSLKNDNLKVENKKEEKPKENKPKEEKTKEIKPKEDKTKEIKSKEDKTKEIKPKEEKPKEERTKEIKPKEDKPKEEKPKEERTKELKHKEDKQKEDKPKEERTKELKQKEEKTKEDKPKEEKIIKEPEKEIKEEKKIISNTPKKEEKLDTTQEKEKVSTTPTIKTEESSKMIEDETVNPEDEKSNDTNNIQVEEGEEEIILKDSEFNKYIEDLYKIFIFWSLTIDFEYPFEFIDLEKSLIKNVDPIEILFSLNRQLKNKKIILKFLVSMEKLTKQSENCYQLFFNISIYSSFLDITFENYKLQGKEEEELYNKGKTILISSFINCFPFCERKKTIYPGKDLDIIFVWGNNILEKDPSKKDLLFDFLFDLFSELLIQFQIKYEGKNFQELSYDVDKNYYFKNYLYFMNQIYIFSFRFRLDKDIHEKKGVDFLYNSGRKIMISQALIDSMRMNGPVKNKIEESWKDFSLVNNILYRLKSIWSKRNVLKNYDNDKYKKLNNNKPQKYQYIIDNIIINKEKKNLYQKELTLLCYEDKKGNYEYLIPLINLVPLTYMCIILKLKNVDEEKFFKYYLKEFKYFIRFLIIASSNLTKINQVELYNSIEEKCFDVISAGLCFLNNLLFSNSICMKKIEKTLYSLILLCLKLVKYQFNYKLNHNKIFNLVSKPARNNLQDCAVCQIFNEYVKDKQGNPLLTLNKLENMSLESKDFASDIHSLMTEQEFIDDFLENNNLKKKLNNGIYSLELYKNVVIYRYDLFQFLQESLDDSYKKTILQLLPLYENELAKYSNNSLEKSIKSKNRYKVFKKNAFSWRGFWSCRENFYEHISDFKCKLINHYTKSFMKPILVPIIDISYYLPEFSGFNPNNLFTDENKHNFKINLDIDKVLKKYEQNLQDNNISNKGKEEAEENYLLNIYKKSNPVLYEKLLNIANNLEFGKEEEFSYVEREESSIKTKRKAPEQKKLRKYFLSCLVKTSHHIKGVCFIQEKKLNFKVFLNQRTGSAMTDVEVGFTNQDDDYDRERKTCFGSYFVCHPKDKDLYKIGINYSEIKWIFKRKYYYINSALEIFTTTNKTFYFNFKYEKDRNTVLNEILKKLDEPIPIIDDLKESNTDNIVGYENGIIQKRKGEKNKNIKLSNKIKLWKNWKMTNFEILMWLNIFGNRSYNDLSQYPVFPWILSNYEDPLKIEQKIENSKRAISMAILDSNDALNTAYTYGPSNNKFNYINEDELSEVDYQYRDMKLPMGMLELSEESIKRKEEFILNYETLVEMGDEHSYVFGSNFSNPIYVCNYLMRLFPFTHISIELQGKGFDKPDRLFLSVSNSFFNSTSQKGDVRELIPEFFYLPEMFLNINKLNMGKLENGKEVNNVSTPCDNNPYDFIMTMKNVLENNKISYTIQNWIDLVFGYKAKGKDAELAKNVYKEAAYQENIDINTIEDRDIKESKLREVEFGLMPNQLMIKECGKKDRRDLIKKEKDLSDPSCDFGVFICKFHNENDKYNSVFEGLPILKFASFAPDKVVIILGGGFAYIEKKISYSNSDKSYYDELVNIDLISRYTSKISEFYNPKKPDSKAIQFCHNGKTLILGGFYDGKVVIEQKNKAIHAIPFIDKSPVIAVAVDQEDELAFFGNSNGNIRIMKIDPDPSKWKYHITISDHISPISSIYCSSELNLWASASIDGYINLYTYPLSKLLRSIKVPTSQIENIFLISSPLPCIIVIGEKNKVSEIFIYSINGSLRLKTEEESIITCPIIIKDLNSNEYLAYILKGAVIVRSIPNFNKQVSSYKVSEIFAIFPSEDMKMIYASNKSGNQIYVIKDISLMKLKSKY